MNAEKMTQKAMEALEAAHVDAVRKGHPELTTLHLLQALLDQEHGLTGNLLGKMGKDPGMLKQAVSEELGKLPTFNGASGRVAASGGMNQVLVRSDDEAKQLGDEYVSVEHLLLAILEEGKNGPAGCLLQEHSIS
ncbi:MAG: Clp protease N-terminal domain-containing protein, partial [SAR324 cluster bacterium]|nr:Clp protease N-terminal domain-containing protein [SAR324 cluster bacterium]